MKSPEMAEPMDMDVDMDLGLRGIKRKADDEVVTAPRRIKVHPLYCF